MEELVYARYMSDIAHFMSKLEEEPDSKYFLPIGLAYNRLEKYQDTIDICRPYLEKEPDNHALKILIAEAYVYTGYQEQAQDLLYDALAGDEGNYKIFKLLGIISRGNKDIDDAIKYFKSAYIRSPEDPDLALWIQELDGTVDEYELYNERKISHSYKEEADETEEWYQEIDGKIRNAETTLTEFLANPRLYKDTGEAGDDIDVIDSVSDLIGSVTDEVAALAAELSEDGIDESGDDLFSELQAIDDGPSLFDELTEESEEEAEDSLFSELMQQEDDDTDVDVASDSTDIDTDTDADNLNEKYVDYFNPDVEDENYVEPTDSELEHLGDATPLMQSGIIDEIMSVTEQYESELTEEEERLKKERMIARLTKFYENIQRNRRVRL